MDAPKVVEKKRILIVEDENDSRDLFVDLFESVGKYEVSSASDGTDALAKLEAERGLIDMLLLDIVMPRMDGIETLRQIKSDSSKYGNPIIIMLTNLGGDLAVESALNLGAQGYLMKIETEPAQLLKKVDEEFARSAPKPVEIPE